MDYLWVEGWTGKRKPGRREGILFQEKEAETMLSCDLSERMLEVCKELG